MAQTSLREMIGSSMLSRCCPTARRPTSVCATRSARKTADWGISVNSVEIRDVAIPVALQDAMSRQAQAEREKQARVILGCGRSRDRRRSSSKPRKIYADHPAALHLRAMNIIYETTKERGATILMPTSMVDSLNIAVPLALTTKLDEPPPRNPAAAPHA